MDEQRSNVNGCGIAAGLGLITIGALLLASRYVDVVLPDWVADALATVSWDWAWTLFIIAPGAIMLAIGLFGPRESAGLAIPGSIVSTLGGIMLFQSMLDAWATWTYVWPLLPAAVGLGLFLFGLRVGKSDVRRVGSWMLAIGLVVFVVFAFFWEVVLGAGDLLGRDARRAVLPALVIIAGILIVFSSFGRSDRTRQTADSRAARSQSPGMPPVPPPPADVAPSGSDDASSDVTTAAPPAPPPSDD
jgi:MFS family permease